MDEKVWYYRKVFQIQKPDFKGNAFLCFDGVAYYCRVWVNNILLGDHEGMFGGPVCDVAPYINLCGNNEIVVEVKACNFGIKGNFDSFNCSGTNSQIIPWAIARYNNTEDSIKTSTSDFIVLGIWNNVRLEFVEQTHISRPYLYTKEINNNRAELYLEFEIANGHICELLPFHGYYDPLHSYMNPFEPGLTGAVLDETVDIEIRLFETDTGKIIYYNKEEVELTDYNNLGMKPEYQELQYFSKTIIIDEPRLWYPVNIGEPYLYRVNIKMYKNGLLCDEHEFNTGIRKIEILPTTGNKYRNRWENFRFSVNEKDFFLKGMNWQPVDYLFDINPSKYEWLLSLVKNAGIQLLRVWSGGGMPETDTFYSICDKLGIMVWQDHMLTNTVDTHCYV